MQFLDWIIMLVPFAAVLGFAVYMRKYARDGIRLFRDLDARVADASDNGYIQKDWWRRRCAARDDYGMMEAVKHGNHSRKTNPNKKTIWSSSCGDFA